MRKIEIGSAVRVTKNVGEVPFGVLGLVVGTVDDHGASEDDPLFLVIARGKKDVYWTEELEAANRVRRKEDHLQDEG